jgi:hypothetical protein
MMDLRRDKTKFLVIVADRSNNRIFGAYRRKSGSKSRYEFRYDSSAFSISSNSSMTINDMR